MSNQAFRILGIAPTKDGRAIRDAFLRLARIYHPDRFVDMPDDVREEAERRMKEATAAYESLRVAKKETPSADEVLDEAEVRKRAVKYREMAAKKRDTEEKDRARWERWERVEETARKKAKLEADMAARVSEEIEGSPIVNAGPKPDANGAGSKTKEDRKRDPLADRLDAARRGETAPLVPRK